MEPLLADIHPDALQITFFQLGAFDRFKKDWVHEKTVPHNIIAQSLAGSYEIQCAGRSLRLKPGEAFLTPAYEPLRIVHHHDKRGRFSARWVHFSFSHYQTIDVTSLLEMPLALGRKTSALLGGIIEELSRSETTQTTLATQLKNLARHRELAWSILGSVCTMSKFKPEAADRLRAGRRLEPLLTHLKHHLSSPISVKEMAEFTHMSPSAFYAFFQGRMGSSPMDFVKRMRLNEAAAQCASTDRQLKEVAACTGFANPFHLSREFKRLFGLSPLNYRKLLLSSYPPQNRSLIPRHLSPHS
jgi:AraC-like DNA-binding protein